MNRHLSSFSLRQHWLAFFIGILLHASRRVLAQASSHDYPPHTSAELKETTIKESLEPTIIEYANPEIVVSNVDSGCRCHDTHIMEVELLASSSRIEELATQVDTLKADISRHDHESMACQKELAEAIAADRKHSKSLEEKIERMERDYSQVLNETFLEIQTLEETVEHQKRNLKSKEDRYQDTRKKFLKVDAELRYMHTSAVNQYVNFTLMREDALNGVQKRFTKANRHVERHYRKLRPHVSEAKRRFIKWKRETSSSLQPKISAFKRNVQRRWFQSKIVRPLLERSWKNILENPTLVDARVSARLSTISAIEEISKGALVFIEKDEQLKQERESGRKQSAIARQLEYKRRHRQAAQMTDFARERNTEPSFIKVKATAFFKSFFKYTLENSERLFEEGVALFPLTVALSVTRSFFVGSCLLLVGIPTSLIWVFVSVRFIRMCRT